MRRELIKARGPGAAQSQVCMKQGADTWFIVPVSAAGTAQVWGETNFLIAEVQWSLPVRYAASTQRHENNEYNFYKEMKVKRLGFWRFFSSKCVEIARE